MFKLDFLQFSQVNVGCRIRLLLVVPCKNNFLNHFLVSKLKFSLVYTTYHNYKTTCMHNCVTDASINYRFLQCMNISTQSKHTKRQTKLIKVWFHLFKCCSRLKLPISIIVIVQFSGRLSIVCVQLTHFNKKSAPRWKLNDHNYDYLTNYAHNVSKVKSDFIAIRLY